MIVAASALRTRAAHREQLERHAIALGESVHTITQRLDFARYLVAKAEAGGQRELAAVEMQIASANADAPHAYERFAGRRLRDVHVRDLEPPWASEQR